MLLLVPEAGSRQPGDAPATLAPSRAGSPSRSGRLAQGPATPTIEVVQVLLVEPGTDAPLSLQLKTTGTLPPQSFIRIRGLPPATSLSEGHFVAPGVWAVPLSSLSTVRITVPAAQAGRSELSVSLVTADRKVLAEAKTTLADLVPRLEAAPEWTAAALESVARAFAESTGAKLGKVAQPLRAALTGRTVSPGVFEMLDILGREESLARLADCAKTRQTGT